MTEITQAVKDDLPGIMEIEKASFSVPWSENNMRFELESEDGVVIVCRKDEAVAGFAVLHCFGEEGEIFNIAVREDMRGEGIASRLMAYILGCAENKGIEKLFLEVRVSNIKAINLYKKYGFVSLGERKNYYEYPTENAVIMSKDMKRGKDQ